MSSDGKPRLRVVPTPRRFTFVLYDHGVAGYEKCGCRCDVCTAAKEDVAVRVYPPYEPSATPRPGLCREWDCERPPERGSDYCRVHRP